MASGPAISLRRLGREDCRTLESWIPSGDALLQWSGPSDFTWPLSNEQLVRDLESATDDRLLLAAIDRDGGGMIGHVMLTVSRPHGFAAIDRVMVDPARRGGGLGIALMREVVRTGFDELGLHRLQLEVYDSNRAAIACYQQAGFVIEGRGRDCARGSDGYWSEYTMALLEDDDRAQRAPRSDGLVIRPARSRDAPAVARLLTELGYPQDAAQAGARLATWAGDPSGTVLIAEVDGAPAGVIAGHVVPYLERPGSYVRVAALAVDSGTRRAGIGRQLLEAVEVWAARLGCRDVEVTSRRTREAAQAFYRTLGFEDLCGRSARFKRPLSA